MRVLTAAESTKSVPKVGINLRASAESIPLAASYVTTVIISPASAESVKVIVLSPAVEKSLSGNSRPL